MNENPAPPPPLPQPSKGIPALGWVGIGCGTVLLIAIVVVSLLVGFCKRKVGEFSRNPEKAAAEMMVKMNPDVTMVSKDDAKGEMTLRTKDGKEMTMSYKEISKGKFMMKDASGAASEIGGTDLSNVPAWVPRVPDVKSVTSAFNHQQDEKTSGLYTATTAKSAEELKDFFKTEAEKNHVTSSSVSTAVADGVENMVLSFKGGGKSLNIVITSKPGEDTQVNVGYEEGE